MLRKEFLKIGLKLRLKKGPIQMDLRIVSKGAMVEGRRTDASLAGKNREKRTNVQ